RLLFSRPPPRPHSTLFPYTTLFRSGFWVLVRGTLPPGAGAGPTAATRGHDGGSGVKVAARCDSDRSQPSATRRSATSANAGSARSEEHTSELQSRGHLVCRLLLEKK